MSHAVLGSIAEIQKENKEDIFYKIKEYVNEYNKQYEDMTFRKKDRIYDHMTDEYKEHLAKLRSGILNLNA